MTSRKTSTATLTFLFFTILLLPSLAFAQDERSSQKYLFGAFGGWHGVDSPQMGGGFGYERLFQGAGFGVEGEAFGGIGYGGGIGSANISYHIQKLTAARDIVPFGTFGYSAAGVCGSSCIGLYGFNFGGGANFWFKPNRGLRVEFRDHVFYDYGATHKLEMRFGLSF